MFLHVSVILSTGGVYPIACLDTPTRDQRQAPPAVAELHSKILDVPPPRGPNSFNFMQFLGKFGKIVCWRPPLESWHPLLGEILDPPLPWPPVQCMLGDTGNKRAVRILLECNLVGSCTSPSSSLDKYE